MKVVLMVLVVLIVAIFAILCDLIHQKRKRKRQKKFIFLRLNTKQTRERLEIEGFKLCHCCTFKGNVWLSPDKDGVIHGIGLPFEGMENLSPKEICAFVIFDERKHRKLIVDCGLDINKFIKECSNAVRN